MTQSVAYLRAPAATVGIGGAHRIHPVLPEQATWSSDVAVWVFGRKDLLLISVRYRNAPSDGRSCPHTRRLHNLASVCW